MSFAVVVTMVTFIFCSGFTLQTNTTVYYDQANATVESFEMDDSISMEITEEGQLGWDHEMFDAENLTTGTLTTGNLTTGNFTTLDVLAQTMGAAKVETPKFYVKMFFLMTFFLIVSDIICRAICGKSIRELFLRCFQCYRRSAPIVPSVRCEIRMRSQSIRPSSRSPYFYVAIEAPKSRRNFELVGKGYTPTQVSSKLYYKI